MTRISHSPKIRPMTREGSATLADTAVSRPSRLLSDRNRLGSQQQTDHVVQYTVCSDRHQISSDRQHNTSVSLRVVALSPVPMELDLNWDQGHPYYIRHIFCYRRHSAHSGICMVQIPPVGKYIPYTRFVKIAHLVRQEWLSKS